jgi:hypothetical protein
MTVILTAKEISQRIDANSFLQTTPQLVRRGIYASTSPPHEQATAPSDRKTFTLWPIFFIHTRLAAIYQEKSPKKNG